MHDRWRVALGELVDIKHGYAFPGDRFTDSPDLPTLLTPANFAIGGGFKSAKPKTFAGEYPRAYELAPGDVVISMTDLSKDGATLGLPAVVPSGKTYLHNQRIGLVTIRDENLVDRIFLNYYLRTSDYRAHVLGGASGSTVRHTSPSRIGSFVASMPALSEQQAIAEVLGALDDKIAANMGMASAIGSHLDAVLSAALADARVFLLNDLASFHNRRRVPLSSRERDGRAGTIPYFGATGQFGWVDEALFDDNLVLVGEDGSVVNADGSPVVQYIWGPSWINNHAHVLTGKGISTELLLLAVRRGDVRSLVTGAVQPKLSMRNLKSLALRIPSESQIERLESLTAHQMALHRSVRDESRTLAALRDTLLPQLMSGRLRVKDAEQIVEESV